MIEQMSMQFAFVVLIFGMFVFCGAVLWAVVTQERTVAGLEGVILSNAQLLGELQFKLSKKDTGKGMAALIPDKVSEGKVKK